MITRKDLVKQVSSITEVSQKTVNDVLVAVLDCIGENLVKGEEISLQGFGRFSVKDTAEKQGVNPSTREPITIPASKRVAFKVSGLLKDKVKANNK